MKILLCEESVLRHKKRNCFPSYQDYYLNSKLTSKLCIRHSIKYRQIQGMETKASVARTPGIVQVEMPLVLIAYVQYIKILTRLRGFLVFFLYQDWFSLCSILFWELQDNGVVKNLQILTLKPQSHVRIFKYRKWAIGWLLVSTGKEYPKQIGDLPSKQALSIDVKGSFFDLLPNVIQRRNLSVHITCVERQTHINFSEVHPQLLPTTFYRK